MFQRCLVQMFESEKKDVVFIETVMTGKSLRHMVIDCIPLDGENAELAPMYFKKAIQECDTTWSQNKKLIDTREKGLRRSVSFSRDERLDLRELRIFQPLPRSRKDSPTLPCPLAWEMALLISLRTESRSRITLARLVLGYPPRWLW